MGVMGSPLGAGDYLESLTCDPSMRDRWCDGAGAAGGWERRDAWLCECRSERVGLLRSACPPGAPGKAA